MTDVTQILSQIEDGDPSAAEQLLPLVYDELRKLAAAKLAQEKPGQTLQATALVHDAYIRLVDVDKAQHWDSRRPLLCCRGGGDASDSGGNGSPQKASQKHGGELERVELEGCTIWPSELPGDDLLAIDEALEQLASQTSQLLRN